MYTFVLHIYFSEIRMVTKSYFKPSFMYQSIIELYWKFLIDEGYSGVSMLNFESKVNKKNI